MDLVISTYGHIDMVINNAGIVSGKNLLDLAEDEVRNVIDTNLLGMFWVRKFKIISNT